MFNELTSTAVAVKFIELNNGQINYTKLIKIMYLFEREMLRHYNRRVTYDELVNLQHGVVLSSIFNRIKMINNANVYWKQYISTHGYDVFLKKDVPDLLLGLTEEETREITLLDEKYKEYNFGQMIDEVHKLVEWNNNPPSSAYGNPSTDFEALLESLEKNENDKEIINIREDINNTPHSKGVLLDV